MRMETNSKLAMLAALLLAGASVVEAQTRTGGASVTRSPRGSSSVSGSSSSGGSGSHASGGTAYRPPSHRSTGSAGVTRRGRTGSGVRPGTPIHRPPSTGRPPGHRPPGYRPSYPIYGYSPYWGWRSWGWPYYNHFYYGFWGWPYYWGRRTPYYWESAYGAPGLYREVYKVRLDEPERGGLQLKIKPRGTQVWIDGEHAGRAKDFDGYPSYLWLDSGSHQISFHQPGYQTETRDFEVLPGRVGQVKLKLNRGESTPPPGPPPPPAPETDQPSSARGATSAAGASQGESGRVKLEVLPGDAAVYLDGRYLGTGRELGRLHADLLVDAGSHELEVVRPGYETERRRFTLEPGEQRALSVRLGGGS